MLTMFLVIIVLVLTLIMAIYQMTSSTRLNTRSG